MQKRDHMKSLNEVIAQTRHDIISIISVESYRPNYLFFPARIKVELKFIFKINLQMNPHYIC